MINKNPSPLVSIVIAAYKSDHEYFLVAINSALNQTYPNIEVLVADDSPSDCLLPLVRDLDDSRIQYFHNNVPLGVAMNHWKAFERAKGEFIAILNHDDCYLPSFVETLVSGLQEEADAVLAFCDHFVVDSRGNLNVPESDEISRIYGRNSLTQGLHHPFYGLVVAQTIPMAMGCIFRKDALPPTLPIDAGPSYDLWLTYLLARGGGAAFYVPNRLSAWRSYEGNLTSVGGMDWIEGSAKCWKEIARDPAFVGVKGVAKQKAAARYLSCAIKSWRQGRGRMCAMQASQSLLLAFSIKGVVALLILPFTPRIFASFLKG